MARRLNKKVAFIGSIFITLILLGGIFVMLKLSKGDPKVFIKEAEANLAKVNSTIADLKANNDYSQAAQETVEELYKNVEKSYKDAFGASDTAEQRIDLLFTLADFYAIKNKYKTPQWDKIRGAWHQIVTIDPKNIEARQKQFDYIYQMQTSLDDIIPGGDPALWIDIEKQADKLIKVFREKDRQPTQRLLKARAWAAMQIAESGQTNNPQKDASRAIEQFQSYLADNPEDTEAYKLLSRSYAAMGRIEAAQGHDRIAEKNYEKQEETLLKGLENASDKAGAKGNYLSFKLTQSEITAAELENIKDQYKKLIADNPSDDTVYNAYSRFLTFYDQVNYDQAIEANEKALEIAPENIRYRYSKVKLLFKKAMTKDDTSSLDKAIETALNALKMEGASNEIEGPEKPAAGIYRSNLLDSLAKCYVERALIAQRDGHDAANEKAIEKLEEAVHQIKQIALANKIVADKWDGMIAMVKKNNTAAVRRLYNSHKALKATQDVDIWVSYYLSKLLEGRTEIGARVEFLTDALFNKNQNIGFISIANVKPDALLDYAEILIQMRRIKDVDDVMSLYEERYQHSERSRYIRVLSSVLKRDFDQAKTRLKKLDPDSARAINLELTLINSRIRLDKALKDSDPGSDPVAADDSEEEKTDTPSPLTQAQLENLQQRRIELLEKFVINHPQRAQFPAGICDSLLAAGDVENVRKIVGIFKSHDPEDTKYKIYARLAGESNVKNITPERRSEITVDVLSKTDTPEAHFQLARHYNSRNLTEKAIAEYRKAIRKDPENTDAIGGLFDIALKNKDTELAEEMLTLARKKDLDKCGGEFFAARVDMLNEKYQNASQHLDNCIEARPIFPYAYLLKSQIGLALENYDAAVENVMIAASMNSIDGMIAKQVVVALQARNDAMGSKVTDIQRSELKDALVRAMALNPNEWQLQQIYANFINERQPENALAVQQNLARRFPTVENHLALGSMAVELAVSEINKEKKQHLLDLAKPAYESAYENAPQNEQVLSA